MNTLNGARVLVACETAKFGDAIVNSIHPQGTAVLTVCDGDNIKVYTLAADDPGIAALVKEQVADWDLFDI